MMMLSKKAAHYINYYIKETGGVAMNRQELLDSVNEMAIHEKDYETLMQLMKNTTPRLFTKIMEEIFLGNLHISDFESIFAEEQRKKYNQTIQDQYLLSKHIEKLTAFRNRFGSDTAQYDSIGNRISNPTNDIFEVETDSDAVSFVKDNVMSSLFEAGVNDDSITKEIKLTLYKKIYQDASLKNDIIVSNGDFLIPISYTKIVLDDYDLKYMHDHDISEEEMKKIKSMALFLENKEGSDDDQ